MTFLPEAFIQSPLFGIALTIVVYVICEIIVDKFELSIIPPFVLACPMIIAFIYFQEPYITYEDYETGAGFINFLLGPATVAQLSARPCHRGAGPAAIQQQAHYKRKPAGNYKRHSCCYCYRHCQHLHLRQNVWRKQPGAAFNDSQIRNNAYCHGYFFRYRRYSGAYGRLCNFYWLEQPLTTKF